MRRISSPLIVALAALVTPTALFAQDMEPKAYSASPMGVNFLVGVGSRSSGNVVLDPSLPVKDVNARIGLIAAGFGHTFGLFGKLTLVSATIPGIRGRVTGKVGGVADEVERMGLGDMRVRLSMNVRGNPAMSAREFAKAPRRTIVGTSFTVVGPSGQYDDTALINIGANRWAFKPEVGISVPKGRWDLDGYVGVWFYTTNPSVFPGGIARTQDPITSVQLHGAYTLRPGAWVAVDGVWYFGGQTHTEGGAPSGGLNNGRLGATISLPIGSRQSIKASYGRGVIVRAGTNFQTVAVAWQILWLSPARK